MATYFGESYVRFQLLSILSQLSADDEVIVVDDASTDDTCNEILAIGDPRIRLFRNAENRGVLHTFERAVSNSSGRIIFLSDQDDLWMPNKVETILRAFDQDSKLTLAASDAVLIDEDGNRIGSSYYETRGRFDPRLWPNILKCKFLGCTMAFRSDLLKTALPFPRSRKVHHDIWLGCVNAWMKGKTLYLDEPLVSYRRHANTVTGRVPFSNYKRFWMRAFLFAALFRLGMKNKS